MLSNTPRHPKIFATPPIDAICNAPNSHSAALQQLCAHGINSLGKKQKKPRHFTTLLHFASPRRRFAQDQAICPKIISLKRQKIPAEEVLQERLRQRGSQLPHSSQRRLEWATRHSTQSKCGQGVPPIFPGKNLKTGWLGLWCGPPYIQNSKFGGGNPQRMGISM